MIVLTKGSRNSDGHLEMLFDIDALARKSRAALMREIEKALKAFPGFIEAFSAQDLRFATAGGPIHPDFLQDDLRAIIRFHRDYVKVFGPLNIVIRKPTSLRYEAVT
jgi:hypothetical protein